ncbi:MAG: ribonuclease H-like domain-containing protein [Patescibacteria group bacterium]|jgi:DNA-directed RNA polymerase subunit RPC12/RpoP
MQPKILLFDIETKPSLAYIWSLWTETRSTDFIEKDWGILCWCAKWLNEKEIMSSALPDFDKAYSQNSDNDKLVLEKLWKLLDEADIVIAHNLCHFDQKKANARFIINGLTPPSPYRVIDTLDVAKRYFAFTSNRLNDLGKFLKIGKKVHTGGFELWRKCMNGDLKAWDKMVRYCKGDVKLLEKVYKKLLPYINTHPNLGTYIDDDQPRCKNCGSKDLFKQGFQYTNFGKYQQYSCKKCGSWMKGRKNLLTNKVKVN